MKNYFTNIIEKVKDFFSNSTPATKIKYGVISLLTIAIAASLIVVVAMNTSEPETPSVSDETKSGEAATIDFDSEIVIDIGEDSEASSKTETSKTETSKTETDSATDTNDPTKDTTETASESKSNKVTKKEPVDPTTESSGDEPIPSDPSTSVSNVDPQPIETTKQTQTTTKQTQATAKQTQAETRPVVTTAKQTQAETKPAETTAKQTQAVTKPAETTAKQTQAETKPAETTKAEESNPQTSGQFVLKEKKYDYNGANVSILQVENKSQQAYTITITGKFKDASGKVIKTESKTFEGFPGGWSNYFVFQPGIKYSSASWGMDTVEFSGKTVASNFTYGGDVHCVVKRNVVDKNGKLQFIITPEMIPTMKEVVGIDINYGPIKNQNSLPINITADTVLFDNNGELIQIGKTSAANILENEPYDRYFTVFYLITDISWDEKDKFVMPDNLKNVSGILAFRSVTE